MKERVTLWITLLADHTSGKCLASYASVESSASYASEESKEKKSLKHDEIYYDKTSSLFNFYKEKSL